MTWGVPTGGRVIPSEMSKLAQRIAVVEHAIVDLPKIGFFEDMGQRLTAMELQLARLNFIESQLEFIQTQIDDRRLNLWSDFWHSGWAWVCRLFKRGD